MGNHQSLRSAMERGQWRDVRRMLEKDEGARIAGWKKVSRYIADNAYVLPLYQQVQPVIHKAELNFTPYVANFILPATMSAKG